MELLNKQDQEVKTVLIAKHDGDILKAAEKLYTWVENGKPVLQEILFHWLQTYDSEMEERSHVIFQVQRIMEFSETLAKIEDLTITKFDKSSDKQEDLRDELKKRLN